MPMKNKKDKDCNWSINNNLFSIILTEIKFNCLNWPIKINYSNNNMKLYKNNWSKKKIKELMPSGKSPTIIIKSSYSKLGYKLPLWKPNMLKLPINKWKLKTKDLRKVLLNLKNNSVKSKALFKFKLFTKMPARRLKSYWKNSKQR